MIVADLAFCFRGRIFSVAEVAAATRVAAAWVAGGVGVAAAVAAEASASRLGSSAILDSEVLLLTVFETDCIYVCRFVVLIEGGREGGCFRRLVWRAVW